MVTGFRFASAGLYLSGKHQWTPVAIGAAAFHDPNPPLTIEEPTTRASLVWRASALHALIVRVLFYALVLTSLGG